MSDTVTHEPDCKGWEHSRRDEYDPCDSWCYGCMRCEPLRDGDYRVCGECMHVYRTSEALLDAHTALLNRLDIKWNFVRVDQIYSCPVCAHDF